MTEDQNLHLGGRVKTPFTQSEMGSESPSWSVFSKRDYWQVLLAKSVIPGVLGGWRSQ